MSWWLIWGVVGWLGWWRIGGIGFYLGIVYSGWVKGGWGCCGLFGVLCKWVGYILFGSVVIVRWKVLVGGIWGVGLKRMSKFDFFWFLVGIDLGIIYMVVCYVDLL